MNALLNNLTPAEFFPFPRNGDYNSITNHAFVFADERWDLSPLIENPQNHPGTSRRIIFSMIPDTLRYTYKCFAYHLLSEMKPQSAAQKANLLKIDLLRFMEEFGLSTFKEFNIEVLLNFNAWLRETYITQKEMANEKPLSNYTLYHRALALKQFLDMARLHKWDDAPSEPIYLGDTSLSEMWEANRQHKAQKLKERAEARLIPRKVWEAIIEAARNESPFTKNTSKAKNFLVYKSGQAEGLQGINFAKYVVLTLAFTGLRRGEVMTLHSHCVFQDRWKRCWLRRITTKTVSEAEEGDIRIPKKLHDALLELKELTKEYRKRSGLDLLFFGIDSQRNNNILPLSENTLQHSTLPGFRKRNPITGEDGEPYYWTPHDMRHTLASILVNDYNVSITTMLRHYAHMSLEMTQHYVHLSKETIKKRALAGFVHANKILFNGKEGEIFVQKLNEAIAEKDMDKALSDLVESYGVNSLPFGVCIYDYRRGHCPNLGVSSCYEIGCKDFVTSDSFLMNFENERDILEMQMERDKRLGRLADRKMKSIKYDKIVKIIGSLTEERS